MTTSLLSTGVQFPDGSVQRTAVPSGAIAVWSGAIASIPPGWFLCNGSNGTPDLRNLFVAGAGGLYEVGTVDGEDSVNLTVSQIPSHGHSVTATFEAAGDHNHTVNINSVSNHTHSTSALRSGGGVQVAPGTPGVTSSTGGSVEPAGSHNHSVSFSSSGSHNHSIDWSLGTKGIGSGHENRPPYYALAYVMKG
jgi:microcystin-dependent protein